MWLLPFSNLSPRTHQGTVSSAFFHLGKKENEMGRRKERESSMAEKREEGIGHGSLHTWAGARLAWPGQTAARTTLAGLQAAAMGNEAGAGRARATRGAWAG